MGRKPHQRGRAMNPVDHPHGGGEGRSSSGRPPVSPWGQQAKGLKNPDQTQGFVTLYRAPPERKLIMGRSMKKRSVCGRSLAR